VRRMGGQARGERYLPSRTKISARPVSRSAMTWALTASGKTFDRAGRRGGPFHRDNAPGKTARDAGRRTFRQGCRELLYFAADSDGLDVTARVFTEIGRDDFTSTSSLTPAHAGPAQLPFPFTYAPVAGAPHLSGHPAPLEVVRTGRLEHAM
jgi:hypothetical protein